jgi:hypothetical protein
VSAKLSRRCGRIAGAPPVLALPLEDRFELDHLTSARQTEFGDLPSRYQRVILEAEAYYARRGAPRKSGAPEAGAAARGKATPALSGR